MKYVRIVITAAVVACIATTGTVRAQTADWTDWAKTDVDGISSAIRCIHMPAGRGGRDILVPRFRNDGTSDFTGWWSVSYNDSDPTSTKRNVSGQQKLVLKAGGTFLAPGYQAEGLCLRGPSITVGT
jgi:hypothetical protein